MPDPHPSPKYLRDTKKRRGTEKLKKRVDWPRSKEEYMHHSSLDGGKGLFVALILVCAFSAAPSTAAEIFKCVAKDGIALYQNFPCNIDSIGSVASNSPSSPPADTSMKKSNIPLVKVTTAPQSGGANEPRVGMSADEVKTLWGAPEEMVADEPATGGRVSNWRYAGGRSVQFDNKHRVLAVQR